MSSQANLLARRAAVVADGLPRVTDVVVHSGNGAHLETPDGRPIIDFAGGIGVMNVGHCHPRVVRAIQEQASTLLHTCIHVATYEPYVALCEKLVTLLPHGTSTKALLVNSGAEAVENAVKIARQATGRQGILCFTEGFHGRTLLGMTLTSKVGYKAGCGPFAPEVYRIPFPNYYRYGDGLSEEAFVEREVRRLRDTFVNTAAPDQLAAVLIEPIQGEGGFVPAPALYLQKLREICDDHGILLICDEVQSGFCRTGRWASYEHYGIVGSLHLGQVSGRRDADRGGPRTGRRDGCARPGTIGGTYGGNPVACAAALASIDVMSEEDLGTRAVAIGNTIRSRLTAWPGAVLPSETCAVSARA
ncbi:MAG: aminotransferase class III-fold pyridoxal phosphate-dependent enzyme [Candidatus Eisenbacteria bacterium]